MTDELPFEDLEQAAARLASAPAASDLFRTLLQSATLGGPRCAICLLKQNRFKGWGSVGYDADTARRVRAFSVGAREGWLGRLVMDPATRWDYLREGEHAPDFGQHEAAETVGVPVRVGGRPVAVIVAQRDADEEPLLPELIRLLTTVAEIQLDLLLLRRRLEANPPPLPRPGVRAARGPAAPLAADPPSGSEPPEATTPAAVEIQPTAVRQPADPEPLPAAPAASTALEYGAVEFPNEALEAEPVEFASDPAEDTRPLEVPHQPLDADPVEHASDPAEEPRPFEVQHQPLDADPVEHASDPAEEPRPFEVQHQPLDADPVEFASDPAEELRPFEVQHQPLDADPAEHASDPAEEPRPFEVQHQPLDADPVELASDPAEEPRPFEVQHQPLDADPVELASDPAEETGPFEALRRSLEADPARPEPTALDPVATPPAPEVRAADEPARRYARLIATDIRLYNEHAVILGQRHGDLADRLGEHLHRGRDAFLRRYPDLGPHGLVILREAFVQVLAAGNDELLREL